MVCVDTQGPSMPKAGGISLVHDAPARPNQKDAHEVQSLLVAGRPADALEHALTLHMWPVAVLIARQLGDGPLNRVLSIMSSSVLRPGSSLHTFGLLAAQDYPGAAGSVVHATTSSVLAPTSPTNALVVADSFGSSHGGFEGGGGMGSPSNTLHPSMSGVATLKIPGNAWAPTLIMLAANRMPGNQLMLGTLGDALWGVPGPSRFGGGDRVAAHICYVLAGRLLEGAMDPDSRFVLPGADHETHRGTYATTAAMQRAEILAWCLHQSNPTIPTFAIAPYLLVVRF